MIWSFSVFYALGIATLLFAAVRWWRARAARSWPTVAGTITASEPRRRLEMADETFVTVVEYVYRVGDRTFRANRIAHDYDESDDREAHRRVHDSVPIGTRVRVRHDPVHPAEATLVPGAHAGTVFLVGFGVWWLLFTAGAHGFQVRIEAEAGGVPWLPMAVMMVSTFGLLLFLVRCRRRERDLVAAIEVLPDEVR